MQVRPTGPIPARIMIVSEGPGERELAVGEAFAGSAGTEFRKMLLEAGIHYSSSFVTSVVRVRTPGNDPSVLIAHRKSEITPEHVFWRDKYVLPDFVAGAELLKREIEMVQPNVIIAVGNVALWALTGEWSAAKWRGSIMPGNLTASPVKVIPTHSPTVVMRQWSMRPIVLQDLRRAGREAAFPEIRKPDWQFTVRPTFGLAHSVLSQILAQLAQQQVKLAVDLETRAGHIACIGIGWTDLNAICIPLMCAEREEGYWTLEEETELTWLMLQIFTHPNAFLIGQNFNYDRQYFYRWWHVMVRGDFDTMTAQHSNFANLPKGLDFLASMYCQYYCYWKDDGKTWDEKTGEDQLWTYNCEDCVRTMEVYQALVGTTPQLKMVEVDAFQQSLSDPVLTSMLKGIRYDHNKRNAYRSSLVLEIMERENWLADVLGYQLNIKSAPQMQDLFYRQLAQKPVFNRKTGGVSCDDEALSRIAEREPLLQPIVRKIQELRSLGVFLSTFVNAPVDSDGRMRCSFNICGTETYRFSSSKNAFGSGLNLQNIPKGGEGDSLDLPNVRDLFIPDPGKTFFDIDLSSADLRIVVWEADEPEFKAMLKAGADPYTEIAKEFYHDPSITKKDPRRQTFKSFAHGTNYLGTAKGLAERLGLNVHEAEQTQKWYFSRFPRIKAWQDDLKHQVASRRMVQNVFGYRCYFFDRIEGTIFNQAAAWIPQSTVACLINRAFVNIYQNLPEVDVLLQVHDSLAGQFDTSRPELADAIVAQAEISLPYPGDPLTIPVGIKTSTKSWGDCE